MKYFFLKKIKFAPSQQGMELQEKEQEKDKKDIGKLFRNSPQKKRCQLPKHFL